MDCSTKTRLAVATLRTSSFRSVCERHSCQLVGELVRLVAGWKLEAISDLL